MNDRGNDIGKLAWFTRNLGITAARAFAQCWKAHAIDHLARLKGGFHCTCDKLIDGTRSLSFRAGDKNLCFKRGET